jgi:outer membrane receptor protein involved in Fe transport
MKLRSGARSGRALAISTATLAIAAGLPGIALAQTAPAAPADDEDVTVVVVTATGRQAAIQDIPIAVTAVTAAAIETAGITDVRNLQQVAPSYRVSTGQSNSAGTSIAIRGIGTGADNPGFEAAVAVFVDGVYRNRSGVALSDLPQIERIEVLRGPQGTLFGRNTSAGAVSVVTAAPKFEWNTYGRMELGSEDWGSATAGITGPLSESTAFRLEASGTTRDGLIDDVNAPGRSVNNRNRWFVRGQILTDLTDNATLRIIADTSRTAEVCCTALHIQTGAFTPAINAVAGLRGRVGIPAVNLEARRGAFSPERNYGEEVEEWGISGELNAETGLGKFTSVTSFRDWTTRRNQDIDFSGIDRAYREGFGLGFETFTQELRLQGESGRLNWLVGAFYANEKTDYLDTVRFGNDAARYVDALAQGNIGAGIPWTPVPGLPVNPCTGTTTLIAAGSTIFGSLGGQNIYAQALCPQLFGQFIQTPGPTLGNAAVSRSLAQQVSGAYGAALVAAAPRPGEGVQRDSTQVETTSLALFTHNQFSVSDDLTVTVGLRYNTETKDVNANLNAVSPACNVLQSTAPIAPGLPSTGQLSQALSATALGGFQVLMCNPVVNPVANGTYAGSREEDAWNGVVSLQYDISDRLMVYGTLSRGYKSGGYNLDRSAFTITPTSTTRPASLRDWEFAPEFVTNYEAGWKWSGLPGRTTVNGAVFWQNIEDYQINAFNGFNFFNFNAPKVVSRGVEMDAVSRPMPGLTLQGGMLWNEAYYDGDTPVRTVEVIRDGTPIAGASEWTFTGSATLRGQFGSSNLGWLLYLDGRYQTEYRTQTLGRAASGVTDQGAFGVINARVGVGDTEQTWSVEAWVRNLADEFYILGSFGVPEQTGNFAVYPGEPRTMGITLRANF